MLNYLLIKAQNIFSYNKQLISRDLGLFGNFLMKEIKN